MKLIPGLLDARIESPRFPIEVIIIQLYKSNTIKHDRMKRVVDKNSGHEYYRFWKSPGEYRPVPFDKIIPSDRGLMVILASPAAGQYFLTEIVQEYKEKEVIQTKFENNKLVTETVTMKVPVVRPINESIRQTAPVLHHRMDSIYPKGKSFFEKYATAIYIIIFAVAIVIPMIFYPMYLSSISDKANGVATQISNLLNQLGVATQTASQAAAGAVKPPI